PLSAEDVDELAHVIGRGTANCADDHRRPADLLGLAEQVLGSDARAGVAGPLARLLLERLDLLQERGYPLSDLARRHAERTRQIRGDLFLRRDDLGRGFAGRGRDPAGAGGDGFLADDLEQADLPDAVEVRPAAELAGEVAHLNDADDVRVLLAEEGHR